VGRPPDQQAGVRRDVAVRGAAPDARHLDHGLRSDLLGAGSRLRGVHAVPPPQPALQRPPEPGQGAVLLLVADAMNEQDPKVVLLGLALLLCAAGHAAPPPHALVPRPEASPAHPPAGGAPAPRPPWSS